MSVAYLAKHLMQYITTSGIKTWDQKQEKIFLRYLLTLEISFFELQSQSITLFMTKIPGTAPTLDD